MIVTITDKGEIRLNSALFNKLETDEAEFRLKTDGKALVILSSGTKLLSVNKNGIVKNYDLIEKLEKLKIKLPAYYVFEFDENNQAFIGNYSAYNPNSRRSKEK